MYATVLCSQLWDSNNFVFWRFFTSWCSHAQCDTTKGVRFSELYIHINKDLLKVNIHDSNTHLWVWLHPGMSECVCQTVLSKVSDSDSAVNYCKDNWPWPKPLGMLQNLASEESFEHFWLAHHKHEEVKFHEFHDHLPIRREDWTYNSQP